MLSRLREEAARIARRSAMALAGAVLLVVAVSFFTAAGWDRLALWHGPAVASLIVGGVYAVFGLVLLVAARGPSAPTPPPAVAPPERKGAPMERVLSAFIDGFEVGAATRRGRDRGRQL